MRTSTQKPQQFTSTVNKQHDTDYLIPDYLVSSDLTPFDSDLSQRKNSSVRFSNVVSESSGSKKPKPVWRSPSYENTPPKHKSSTKSSHASQAKSKNNDENIYIQPVQQINEPVYVNQPIQPVQQKIPPPLPKNPPSVASKSKRKKQIQQKPVAYQARIPKEYRLDPSIDPSFYNADQYVPEFYHQQLWNAPSKMEELNIPGKKVPQEPKEMVSVEIEAKIGEETLKEHKRQQEKTIK